MTPREFCFWFMGSLELSEPENGLDEAQTQMLINHLDMVFIHMVNEDGSLKDEPIKMDDDFDMMNPSINC